MRILLFFFFIISFSACERKKEQVLTPEEVVVSKRKNILIATQKDTTVVISKSFFVNDIECYWQFRLILEDRESSFGIAYAELVDKKSGKIILQDSSSRLIDDVDTVSLRTDNFKDLNFDNYKDYYAEDYGQSGSSGAFFNVYLFDNRNKIYTHSPELSDTELQIDSVNKTISSFWKAGISLNHSTVKHISNSKIKFIEDTKREVISWKADQYLITTYTKTQNNKVVETKIDTALFEGY